MPNVKCVCDQSIDLPTSQALSARQVFFEASSLVQSVQMLQPICVTPAADPDSDQGYRGVVSVVAVSPAQVLAEP